MHPSVAKTVSVWRAETPYKADRDFVFPSLRLNGKKPVKPDMVLKKTIRPALERAGVKDKGSAGTASAIRSLRTFVPLEWI